MRSLRVVLVVATGALAVAAAAACSTNYVEASTAADAAPPAAEAGKDAADDGGAPVDAATDASHCTTLVTESFTALPTGFTVAADNTAPVTLDGTRSTSPPTALYASVTPATESIASIVGDVSVAGGLGSDTLLIDYELFSIIPAKIYAEPGCTTELRNANGVMLANLLLTHESAGAQNAALSVPDGGSPIVKPLSGTTLGAWYHAHVELRSASGGLTSAKFTLGAAGELPVEARFDVAAPFEKVRLRCGIPFALATGGADGGLTAQAWVDDLVVQRCTPP